MVGREARRSSNIQVRIKDLVEDSRGNKVDITGLDSRGSLVEGRNRSTADGTGRRDVQLREESCSAEADEEIRIHDEAVYLRHVCDRGARETTARSTVRYGCTLYFFSTEYRGLYNR